MIEANRPIPYDDVETRTVASSYKYLYSKEIPMTEAIKAIHTEFEDVDFHALLNEQQKYDGRGYQSLIISWGDFSGISLTIKYVNCCTNHEAIRIHRLMQRLFSEIHMEEWYVTKK